ncbi:MAG: class I SAM-dependent methyltransferase [Myxococcales bacterium]|nr:class I SAM-dependent methyltransferase [Myxococcales bacterium]
MSGAYDAALYALVHRGTEGDEAFYAKLATGKRVLELGAGYGRLLPALTDNASRYVGIEHDPGMLAAAERARLALPVEQRERAALVRADMRDFALQEEFDRILIPHSGLWCLGGATEVARCLDRVLAHLAEGGLLILDTYHADPFHEHSLPEDVPDDREELVAEVEHAGTRYQVFERSSWDRDAQRMVVTYRYAPDAEGEAEVREGVIVHSYLLCDELATVMVNAGLESLRFAGDFAGTPLDDDDDFMVVVAAR